MRYQVVQAAYDGMPMLFRADAPYRPSQTRSGPAGLPHRRPRRARSPRPQHHGQAAEGLGGQGGAGRLILTESQLAALEKAKADKEAHGEFDSACPGYCGAQDTFYVGTLKGVGRIYQQTFVDTYAKVGFTKLYDVKTAITAADLLNDRVLPFYEEHGIPLCRVLTDRGSEYCGNPERHEYELYLAIEDIDHSRTKTKSPQTNGILRALPQDRARRVLPGGLPQEALPQHRRAAGRPRPMAPPVQRGPHPPGPMVLRQDADADLP